MAGEVQTVAPIRQQVTESGWALCDQDPSPDPVIPVVLHPPLAEIDDPVRAGRVCRLLWPVAIPVGTYRVAATASQGATTSARTLARPPTITITIPPSVTCRADEQPGEATITGSIAGKWIKLRVPGCVPKVP